MEEVVKPVADSAPEGAIGGEIGEVHLRDLKESVRTLINCRHVSSSDV